MQLVLMFIEAMLLAAVYRGLSRARGGAGLLPLGVAVGVTQHLQVLLASTLYVEILPGVTASPGSAVLFSATLFACLLVWKEHGLEGTRGLIYGLIVANLTVAGLGLAAVAHMRLGGAINVLGVPDGAFVASVRVMVVGTGLLFVDVVLVIAFWETFGGLRRVPVLGAWLQGFMALLLVQTFDTTVFLLVARPWEGLSLEMVGNGILAKGLMCLVFATVLELGSGRTAPRPLGDLRLSLGDLLLAIFVRERFLELRDLALRDPLTGLLNRRGLEAGVEELLRTDSGPLSAVLIDIDDFKRINDEHGHAAGDAVLKAVGRSLEQALREGDLACRHGGDEFLALIVGARGGAAWLAAERIREVLLEGLAEVGEELKTAPLTVSLGLSTGHLEALDLAALIAEADGRLADAKRGGKNRLVSQPDSTAPVLGA